MCAISKFASCFGSAALRRLVGATLLLASPYLPAQDLETTSLSGSMRMNYFSSSRDLDDLRNLLAAAAEVKLVQSLPHDQSLQLEARFSYEQRLGEDDYEARLLNANWSATWGASHWRIGQQKVRWGKADGINPTDFFTPIDYTQLLPLEADQYQSILAIRTDIDFSQSDSLSLVISPDFTPTRLPWPSVSPVAVVEDEPSGTSRPQAGIRWSHSGSSADWSLSAFRGFSTLPVLNLREMSSAGAPLYERYFPESVGIGADLAKNVGKWAFRAELAYTNFDEEQERQGVASNYSLVSGVDRSFENWNVNVQGIVRYTNNYRSTLASSNAADQFAATMNGIVYHQLERLSTGMTLRVAAHWWRETLQTELLSVVLFEPTNYFIRPLITFQVSDRQTLTAGAEYYAGPSASYFGLLEKNRTVFAEFRQYF